MAQMAAQLNQANFGQAQAAATGDITAACRRQLANQAPIRPTSIASIPGVAAASARSATQAQHVPARNFGEQLTAGQMEQQQAQNQINAQMAKFQQAANYPNQQLGILQSALGMTPYEQGDRRAPRPHRRRQSADPLGMALGGLQALGGLFGGGSLFGRRRRLAGLLRSAAQDRHHQGRHASDRHRRFTPIATRATQRRYPEGGRADGRGRGQAFRPRQRWRRSPARAARWRFIRAVLGALSPPASTPIAALTPGPRGGAGPIGTPPGGFGMGPPVPGALAGPGVAGAIGALGGSMRARRPRLGAFGG